VWHRDVPTIRFNSVCAVQVGFVMGTGSMLSLLDLMTAIYWGQLSNCRQFEYTFAQYSCSRPAAYTAVCFFAMILFLSELAFTVAVFYWRGELIQEEVVSLYGSTTMNALGGHSHGGPESTYLRAPNAYAQAPTSADL
jgi:hypothetical protein